MELVTVGRKYQIVIPKTVRKKLKGIKPGTKVALGVQDENTATIKTAKESWSDKSYGFMREGWKDIDPAAEIEKMRDEWESRR